MLRTFGTIFLTVFVAEIGDKTQLATMLFAAEGRSKWLVFAAAGLALLFAAAIGVLVGAQIERWIAPRTLKLIAAIGFVAIGIWTFLSR
ncbi:MAG TPA: TMEM165/GDT1 family protein [Thermoanaerobaculia bacterium]|jgi:putative Ca2+/H+ antiporter (TMEM165/GDT1 family)|nr:TMEM165/GDT1 family protein [Thermoanaerobaculia bacterium]